MLSSHKAPAFSCRNSTLASREQYMPEQAGDLQCKVPALQRGRKVSWISCVYLMIFNWGCIYVHVQGKAFIPELSAEGQKLKM